MSKKEQFGLDFIKVSNPVNGKTTNACKKSGDVNQHNTLQIIQQLNQVETQAFIDEIRNAINDQYYKPYFTTDSFEAENIELKYPNVIFGENDLIISMQDLLELLQEWLEFINT